MMNDRFPSVVVSNSGGLPRNAAHLLRHSDPQLAVLTQRAAVQLGLPIALLVLVDTNFHWTQAAYGLPADFSIPKELAFRYREVAAPERVIMMNDVQQDVEFRSKISLIEEMEIRFYASAPLSDSAGLFLGVLYVFDTHERTLDVAGLEKLAFLAEFISSRIESHRLNAALRDSADHYRHCIQLNQQVPWTASARGRNDMPGSSWLPDLMPRASPVTENYFGETVAAEDAHTTLRAWARSVRSGDPFDVEYRRRVNGGELRWFRSRAAPRRDETGQIVRWYGTVEDVHERKMAEISRRSSDERLRSALDAGRLGAWEVNVVSHRVFCSDLCAANFGLADGEQMSSYDTLLRAIHPEDRDRCGIEVQQVFLTGRELNVEFRVVWPDGSTHWNHVTGRVIYDDRGKPWRAAGLSADISVRREVEQARANAEATLLHLANHDALTGLANRRCLDSNIIEAIAASTTDHMTMLYLLDLDQFKTVNDLLGHAAGDRLLQYAATRLKGCVRQHDTVARYGGDEFTILQHGIRDTAAAEALAQRILNSLAEPYDLDGRMVVLGCSIGIAIATADDIDPDQLRRNADTALYRAKASGRGIYRFYEAEMDERQQARDALKLGLAGALTNRELRMFYQPLINLQTLEVDGFEALMRWDHPDRGLIGPGEFIPVAEESGYIVRFGRFALHEACSAAVQWPGNINLAINLSAVQFGLGDLVRDVTDALVASGLSPARLELEVTETLLLQGTTAHTAMLEALRRIGLRIVMDDFGTGYSSLGYLRQFKFDKLKIDRSLVSNLPDHDGGNSIVEAILGLGRSLRMDITAEGVETTYQLEYLINVGCQRAQGYLFSRPVPPIGLTKLLQPRWAAGCRSHTRTAQT